MDVQRLELLRELRDRGSVRAVAEATRRSASAVSQQIKLLERQAGVPLTEPAGRGIRLTDAGLALANSADRIALAIAQSQAIWDEFRNQPSGSVSVLSVPSVGRLVFPQFLRRVETHSGLIVQCSDRIADEGDLVDLTQHFDIVLAHSTSAAPIWARRGLVVVPLFTEPFDIALPSGHPLAKKSEVEATDLIDEIWIGVPDGFPYHTTIDEVQAASGRPVTVRQRFSEFSITERLVAEGLGIAALPRFTTSLTSTREIVLRPLAGSTAHRLVVALARPERASRLAVRVALEDLQATTSEWQE